MLEGKKSNREVMMAVALESCSLLLPFLIIIIFLVTILSYIWNTLKRGQHGDPTCWPMVGMLPCLIHNYHRLHDFATDVLTHAGGSFYFKGARFGNSDFLITSDPANIHHILSRNFANYPKGAKFRRMFDVLGDGIFNADFDIWETHRKTTMSLLNHARFGDFLMETTWNKVENGLLVVLDTFLAPMDAPGKGVVDLQDIFQRFTFDTISVLTLGNDPRALSIDLPDIPTEKAINVIEEAIMYRNILPERFWRLQKWLGVGTERKLAESWVTVDNFFYSCITSYHNKKPDQQDRFSAIALYSKVYNQESSMGKSLDVFLRDTFFNLMIAGRDTTSSTLSWFFWLLARNPHVGNEIRAEIQSKMVTKGLKECFMAQDFAGKLVYLHGALCETLRLFPAVAFQSKSPLLQDVLPSGDMVMPGTKIVMSFYSMGRMERIWGKDVLEFKPERWISDRNKDKNVHVPSFKFPAFNAGPRTCLGKEMAFTQMKIVASVLLMRYDIQVEEHHPVMPGASILLHMKHGLKVRITPRNESNGS